MPKLASLTVDDLLRRVFPVEQELAEADGVADENVCDGWREIRRRLESLVLCKSEADRLRELLKRAEMALEEIALDTYSSRELYGDQDGDQWKCDICENAADEPENIKHAPYCPTAISRAALAEIREAVKP